MSKIKQIILIRKDLKIRRGKEISAGAHASISFLTKRLKKDPNTTQANLYSTVLSNEEIEWINSGFAKICLQVADETELMEIYQKALKAGLETHMIIDFGLTEFNGVKTKTACAIGPHDSEKIDEITGCLKLY